MKKGTGKSVSGNFLPAGSASLPASTSIINYINNQADRNEKQYKDKRRHLALRIKSLKVKALKRAYSINHDKVQLFKAALLIKNNLRIRASIRRVNSELLQVAFKIMEKFLRELADKKKSILTALINDAIRDYTEIQSLKLIVSKIDMQSLRKDLETAGIDIRIETSPEISPGNCILQDEQSQIEISWQKYLEDIRTHLLTKVTQKKNG